MNRPMITRMHICCFENPNGFGLERDLQKYPDRLCILDEEKDIVFDKMSKKPSVREFGSDEFNFTLLEYCNFIKNNSNYKEDNRRSRE